METKVVDENYIKVEYLLLLEEYSSFMVPRGETWYERLK